MSADDFTRAVNWVAENLHDDKSRYKSHPIQEVRDRIDEIRAERGLPPFKQRARSSADTVSAWINGKRTQPAHPTAAAPAAPVAAAGTNPAYVKTALDDELAELAAAVEGYRNDTLHRVACNVFEFVKSGHVDQSAAVAELTRVSAAIGLPDSEIQTTLRSAWNRVGPRVVPAPTRIGYTLTELP